MTSRSSATGRQVTLSDLVSRGDLRSSAEDSRTPLTLTPTPFDKSVLDVIDAVVSRCMPAALLLPTGGTHVPVVAAAAMLVRHISLTGGRTARIALVSKDLGHRPYYRTLHFRDQPLQEHFPMEVITAGGSLAPVGSLAPFLDGRLRVSVDTDRLLALDEAHDGIVVEAGGSELSDMRRLLQSHRYTVPIVYLATNPFDPVLEIFSEEGVVWAWSPEEIRELATGANAARPICADPQVLAASTLTTYVVTGPRESSDVDTLLAELWDDVRSLSQAAPPGDPRIRWAWTVVAGLAGCPVPIDYHDLHAGGRWAPPRFGDAVRKAEAFAQNAQGEIADYFEILAGDLDSAVRALTGNPKSSMVATWIAEMDPDQPALIVTRNRTTAAALVDYLHETPGVPFGWEQHVRVYSFSELERGRAGWRPETLFTGPVPHSRAGLVSTPAARRLTVLAHGPWEAGRIVNQIRETTRKLEEWLESDRRNTTHRRIFGAEPDVPYDETGLSPQIEWDGTHPTGVPAPARRATWSPFALPATRLDDEEEHAQMSSRAWEPDSAAVPAIRVDFDDGVAFFEPDIRVSRIRKGQEKEVAARSLQPGDHVILVDRGARSDLFDMIVNTLEDLPEYAPITRLVREWQARAERARHLGLTYPEILARMRQAGSGLTTPATISHWTNRRTHGPDDAEDIKRFGQVIGDTFLQTHWQRIGRALRVMRSQHRQLGRQLAGVLQGTSSDSNDGYFDRRLGIHMTDLTATLSTHLVEGRGADTVEVPSRLANILLTYEQAGEIEERGEGE